MKPIQIFYSWQSDLSKETNQNGIRQALRNSLNLIEVINPDFQIIIDEATRNVSGSPNIPQTIFNKISNCDIFLCDLTTINQSDLVNRKVPNPNVLIELGYAIASVGWTRIIMLFNINFGSFPNDLPFDIDRHRATQYSILNKKDKNGINQLTQVLKNAINSILTGSPIKPSEKKLLTAEMKKRESDISSLKRILGTIHIETFDMFLEEIPLYILKSILFYRDCFFSVLESSSFHIYDKELLKLLSEFATNWGKSLSFPYNYDHDRIDDKYKFYIPGDEFRSKKDKEIFEELKDVALRLDNNYKQLLSYVRNNFFEIDLKSLSEIALESFKHQQTAIIKKSVSPTSD